MIVDAGLDLGKSEPQSLALLRATDVLAALGYPVLLSASNKRFLGVLLDLDVADRREAIDRRARHRHLARRSHLARPRRARHSPHRRRHGRALRRAGTGPRMSTHLLRGADPALLADAVAETVHRLVGDEDRALMVDDIADEAYEVVRIVDAARTPPFLTSKRVVVARHVEQFTRQDQVAPLIEYLGDPLDTTELVLVSGGTTHKALVEAVKSSGGTVVDTDPGRAAKDWLDAAVRGRLGQARPRRTRRDRRSARRGPRPPPRAARRPRGDLRPRSAARRG